MSRAVEHLDGEARFRSFFESAPIGAAIIATDGRFREVNDALCQLVGYSREEFLGTSFEEITHPDDREADREFERRMLAGEIRTYQTEKRYIHRLGHVVWVLASVSLVRKDDGSPSYFIGQVQDISDRKRAEEERDRLRHQLEQTQRLEAVGRLAFGIAHDFNNMLTAIKGYSALVVEELAAATRDTTRRRRSCVPPSRRPVCRRSCWRSVAARHSNRSSST